MTTFDDVLPPNNPKAHNNNLMIGIENNKEKIAERLFDVLKDEEHASYDMVCGGYFVLYGTACKGLYIMYCTQATERFPGHPPGLLGTLLVIYRDTPDSYAAEVFECRLDSHSSVDRPCYMGPWVQGWLDNYWTILAQRLIHQKWGPEDGHS